MRKILVTGGTVFVSRSLAEYFVKQGDDVFVLNRNNHPQAKGVTLIEGDRYDLGDLLSNQHFDVVIDANAYTAEEINLLLDALPSVKDYIFISTSAVYPENLPQPFTEEQKTGPNSYWKTYGTDKIEAEEVLATRVPQAYILRPAYIYGPYNNAYREAFVFDCAKDKRPFYLPNKGEMLLQFIHMEDICRLVNELLLTKPEQKIYNVGNEELISVKDWVKACYEVVGAEPVFVEVDPKVSPRQYFSFPDYEYAVDVSKQRGMIGDTKSFKESLAECYQWYQRNEEAVNKQKYLEFIDQELER